MKRSIVLGTNGVVRRGGVSIGGRKGGKRVAAEEEGLDAAKEAEERNRRFDESFQRILRSVSIDMDRSAGMRVVPGSGALPRIRGGAASAAPAAVSTASVSGGRPLDFLGVDGRSILSRSRKLREGVVRPETLDDYHRLLREASEQRDAVKLERLFHRLCESSISPTLDTYRILLEAYVSTELLDSAVRTFHELQAAGFSPDAAMYRALLRGCAKTGDLDRTFGVVESMRAAGFALDVAAHTSVLQACSRAGAFGLMWEHHREMRDAGVPYDHDVYSTLVLGCAAHGKPRNAAAVMRLMRADGVRPSSTLLEAYLHQCLLRDEAEGLEFALELLAEASEQASSSSSTPKEEGESSNPTASTNVLQDDAVVQDLMDSLARRGRADACASLWQTLAQRAGNQAVPPEAYAALALAYARSDRWLDLWRALQALALEHGPAAGEALRSVLAKELVGAPERLDKALAALMALREERAGLSAALPEVLLRACALARDVQTADAVMLALEPLGVPLDGRLLAAFLRVCETSKAFDLAAAALHQSVLAGTVPSEDRLWEILAETALRSRRVGQALGLMHAAAVRKLPVPIDAARFLYLEFERLRPRDAAVYLSDFQRAGILLSVQN